MISAHLKSTHAWFFTKKHGNSTKVALVKHDLETKHLGLDTADMISKSPKRQGVELQRSFVENVKLGGCQPNGFNGSNQRNLGFQPTEWEVEFLVTRATSAIPNKMKAVKSETSRSIAAGIGWGYAYWNINKYPLVN